MMRRRASVASPLESALRLAGEGMYLFPLRPGDKKPIIADWPRLATCEPSTIHCWAREYRNCNWGILCGRQSGIWVLDCDRKNGSDGMATLRQYWDISWARTFTVRTPHNGVQFYYAYSDDLGEIRNQNPLLPGVDVRGQGGYVVAVGSVLISCDIPGCRCHPSEYRILVDRPFNASVKARRFYFAHRRTGQSEAPPPSTNGRFPIGQRNSALFRMALAMHQAHMTPEVILDGALRMNREHFDPPLPEHEVASLVDRVIKYSAPPRVVIGGSPDSLDEKLVSVDQALAAAHPEPDWLVDHLFPSASILAIVAMIKTGKTTFLLDVIRHLLNGEPWCGLHTKRTAVIYLTEQSPVSFNTELQLAGIGAGAAMRILYRPEVIKFGWLSVAKRVIEWVARFECGLVVVDTLTRWADLVGEGESHAGSVKIINCLESVLATGCSLALVYHSGKDGDNRVVENAIRGSSAWGGAADQIYRLRRPHGNQRDNCRILESSGRYNHLIAEKLGLRFVDDRYEITSRKEVEKIATGAINQLL